VNVHRFRAMGCDVVVAGGKTRAIAAVFEWWEATFSRFRPGSELSRINASPAAVLQVSALFARVLRIALEIAAETDGLVDPTLGRALEAAGYDRDFSSIRDDPLPPGCPAPSRLGEVVLHGSFLRRPPGIALDLNGVVKALAVDDAAGQLAEGFVSAGGDLAVRGAVDVGLPYGDAVRVLSGGLATSGVASRRWRRGGTDQHHLIDPRTGRPSASPWKLVTVSGATCLDADAAAKAAYLLGDDGPDWLEERGLPGRFVGRNGGVVRTGGWDRALACI
jgi:thiamine biosynthesis lipoprotein